MSIDHRRGAGRVGRSTIGGVAAGLALVLAILSPVVAVSGPTKLLDPAVSPRAGAPSTVIRFEVTYRNREGSPPDRVTVTIGGVAHEMTAPAGDDAWKQGVVFGYATKLPAGTHSVTFAGIDRERLGPRGPRRGRAARRRGASCRRT